MWAKIVEIVLLSQLVRVDRVKLSRFGRVNSHERGTTGKVHRVQTSKHGCGLANTSWAKGHPTGPAIPVTKKCQRWRGWGCRWSGSIGNDEAVAAGWLLTKPSSWLAEKWLERRKIATRLGGVAGDDWLGKFQMSTFK